MSYDRDIRHARLGCVLFMGFNLGDAGLTLSKHYWVLGLTSGLWAATLGILLPLTKMWQLERDRQRDHIRIMNAMIEEMERRRR